MAYICQYCEKSFSRSFNLKKHQETAQYCLKIQGRKPNKATYKCTTCGKRYHRSDKFEQHKKTCTTKIDVLTEKIDQLQSQIMMMMTTNAASAATNIVNTPSVNNNNRNVVVNNLQPITDEEMQQHVERLTIDFILDGAKGFADFANCYPFKDKLVCVDRSRRKLRYRGQDGDVIDDPHGKKLTQRFFQAIAEKNAQLVSDEYQALQQQVADIAAEGDAGNVNLPELLSKSVRLQDTLRLCNEAASGRDNELTQDFIRCLTKMIH